MEEKNQEPKLDVQNAGGLLMKTFHYPAMEMNH